MYIYCMCIYTCIFEICMLFAIINCFNKKKKTILSKFLLWLVCSSMLQDNIYLQHTLSVSKKIMKIYFQWAFKICFAWENMNIFHLIKLCFASNQTVWLDWLKMAVVWHIHCYGQLHTYSQHFISYVTPQMTGIYSNLNINKPIPKLILSNGFTAYMDRTYSHGQKYRHPW